MGISCCCSNNRRPDGLNQEGSAEESYFQKKEIDLGIHKLNCQTIFDAFQVEIGNIVQTSKKSITNKNVTSKKLIFILK